MRDFFSSACISRGYNDRQIAIPKQRIARKILYESGSVQSKIPPLPSERSENVDLEALWICSKASSLRHDPA